MHLPHLFNFIKIYNKTALISMIFLNAFSAKNSKMIGAIKVLDPLVMLITQKTIDALFVFKVDVS